MKKKYYHFDIETGDKYEITKEEHEAFERLWNSCTPKIFKELGGKIIIFGTGGSSNDLAEFKNLFYNPEKPDWEERIKKESKDCPLLEVKRKILNDY